MPPLPVISGLEAVTLKNNTSPPWVTLKKRSCNGVENMEIFESVRMLKKVCL